MNEGANSGCATILDIDMCPIYAGYPSEGLQTVAYDREKALDYLAASSYSGESFEILCQSGTACETVAKIIQSQLIELGIAATVTAVDSSSYTQLQLAGDYDASSASSSAPWWTPTGPRPSSTPPPLRLHEKLQVPPRG